METERTEYTGLHENIDDYVFFLEDPGGITEMIDDILWEQIVHEIYKEFSPREAFVFDAILRKRKTHREIAEELHVPTNTVTSIMRRIRLKCIKIRDEQKKSVIGQVIEDK